jgi:hypothetical protein
MIERVFNERTFLEVFVAAQLPGVLQGLEML